MPYGLYLSAEGAHAQARRMEVIANNLANVDTVGFKREMAIFQARYAEDTAQGRDYAGSGSINDLGGGIMVESTRTDFSPAALKQTHGETDLALDGEGYFAVQKDGQRYLTRAGNFRINGRGELVTQQGYAVLNDAGAPVTIDPAAGPPEFTRDGAVRQRGAVQHLAIVRPDSPGDLAKAGENLFRPLADPSPLAPAQRNVAVGFLEASGVSPTREMVQLIEASRAIEANVNMMQTQDQMLAGLVNRVMRG